MGKDVDLQTKPTQVGIFQTNPGHFREVPMKYKRYLAPESQRSKAEKAPHKLLGDNRGGPDSSQPPVQSLGPTLKPLTLANFRLKSYMGLTK